MITKESADCTHAWEDDDGNSCACYECVVRLAERLQSELDEDATDSGRHLALLIEERQRSERLQAIVDRLPKTADGVPIVPGGDYWSNNDRGTFQWSVVELHQTAASGTFHGSPCVYESYDECYSTREAAEKARQA